MKLKQLELKAAAIVLLIMSGNKACNMKTVKEKALAAEQTFSGL